MFHDYLFISGWHDNYRLISGIVAPSRFKFARYLSSAVSTHRQFYAAKPSMYLRLLFLLLNEDQVPYSLVIDMPIFRCGKLLGVTLSILSRSVLGFVNFLFPRLPSIWHQHSTKGMHFCNTDKRTGVLNPFLKFRIGFKFKTKCDLFQVRTLLTVPLHPNMVSNCTRKLRSDSIVYLFDLIIDYPTESTLIPRWHFQKLSQTYINLNVLDFKHQNPSSSILESSSSSSCKSQPNLK